MANKIHLRVTQSEGNLLRAAAEIYSGYLASGAVNAASEESLVTKSVEIAIQMAQQIDDRVHAAEELA